MLSLNVEKRTKKDKLEALRRQGKIPAVYYGPKESSQSVSISAKEFEKVWHEAGESSVIAIKDSASHEHEALIHEVDVHPLSGEPRHVDFYVIEKGKKVEVAVPLSFVGVAPAVRDKGGILVKVMREIEVEATPLDLPREIPVDISVLVEMTDVIKVKGLILPENVEVKTAGEEIIASITEAKEEVVETPTPIDMSAIEVEAKGKEVKPGEEGVVEENVKAGADAKKEEKKGEGKK